MKIRRHHDLAVAVLSLCAGACGYPAGGPPSTARDLCDGSADVRLAYKVGGGHGDGAEAFYALRGSGAFFAVDGGCHYWAGRDLNDGLRTGTLGVQMADMVARDLHVGEIAGLSSHQDTRSCSDAGYGYLGRGAQFISCTCGCDELPAAISQAFVHADSLNVGLVSMGAPSDGPLWALTMEIGGPNLQPAVKVQDWPLPSSPSALAADTVLGTRAEKVIESGADRAALRGLRAGADATGSAPIYVRGSDGFFYALYLRDELPVSIEQALTALGRP
jgi:hypothetical protein